MDLPTTATGQKLDPRPAKQAPSESGIEIGEAPDHHEH